MKDLVEFIRESYVTEAGDKPALGTAGAASKKSANLRSEIKFTIWEKPDSKVSWVKSNEAYQKIEYCYEDANAGIAIDFLLGFKDGSWKMWMGKPGAVSYDDDPWCSFDTESFSEAVMAALDKVEEMIEEVKKDKLKWVQFYLHR